MIRLSAAALLATTALAAANPFDLPQGGSGFKLLKSSATPRDQALSGAGTGGPGIELSANPATDSVVKSTISAGWVQTYGQFGGSLQDAGWQIPFGDWNAEGRVRYEGFSGLSGRDETDQGTGAYGASTWSGEAGFSAPLPWEGLRAGLILGGGMDAVSDASAWGAWMGGGLRWAPRSFPLGVGLAVENLGMGTTSGQYRERLPAVVQLGVSWTQKWGNWTLIPMADVRQVADEDLVVPLALEALWNGLAFRTGFPVGRPEARPSFGMGYSGDSWGIDAGLGWHAALGFAPSGQLSLRF